MVQVVMGKCSHCNKRVEHKLDDRSVWRRNLYVCNACGERTVSCRICDGMAKVGPLWADELCQDHWADEVRWKDGAIDCVSEWPTLWKGSSGWIKSALWLMSPYRADAVESFDICRLNNGQGGVSVICVNGFMGQSDSEFGDWKVAADVLFPGCRHYGLRWESRRGQGGAELAALVAKEAPLALRTFGLTALLSWLHTSQKAADTGRMLAGILMRTTGQQFVLCGHSLGARVIFYALCELAEQERLDVVRTVHLMGGAVGVNDEEAWKKAASACSYGITNYLSSNDDVLRWLYTPAMGFSSDPIGLNRISVARNVDVSAIVTGHNDYKRQFGTFASFPTWL